MTPTSPDPLVSSPATSWRLEPRGRVKRRSQELWIGVSGLVIAGLFLGTAITTPGSQASFGTALVALGALAAVYRPAAGMAIFAFSLPFGLTASVGPFNIDASAVIMVVAGLSWAARATKSGGWRWRTKRLDVAVAVFAAATVLSVAVATGLFHQQPVGLSLALSAFLVFFLASRTPQTTIDVWLIVGALISATLVQATSTAFGVLTKSLVVSEDTRVSADLADPNHFAGILVLVCLLVIAVGIGYRQVWAGIPTALASLVLCAVLLATLSRSAWLGLLAGVVLLFCLLPERRPQIAAIAGFVTVVLLVAGLAGPVAARLAPHPTGPWEMLASRWRVWTAALAMIADHPIFGVGLDKFGAYYPYYSVRPAVVEHAHNLFLNIFAERGIFGLLSFTNVVVAYFLTVGNVLRRANTGPLRAFSVGLIASFGGYLVHSLFETSYLDSRVLFLVWILIGLAAALPNVTSSAMPVPEPSSGLVPVSREAR
jgi:O-antigen ligase